jgi:hypothetical protein
MKVLVVARYAEDTDWTELTDWRVRIVQKDRDLPNRGREPSSFIWRILHDWERIAPDDVYAFVQGNPFDHCPDLWSRLLRPVTRYTPLGHWQTVSDANGNPHHHGVPVGACHAAWLGRPFPGEVTFTAGGQFALTGADLLARPIGLYRRMYDDLMEGSELVPYAAERLWGAIFGGTA